MDRSPRRILLVDDEVGIQRIVQMALANYGFVTTAALDAASALSRLEHERFDVIVSDVHMPGHDGIELLRTLRQRGVCAPVVLMSGRASAEVKRRALLNGAFRFLVKPVMPSELRRVIEEALTGGAQSLVPAAPAMALASASAAPPAEGRPRSH